MVLGLLLASFLALVRPDAFFNRRSRANWLDELSEIRQEALVLPEGGVDHAMGDDEPEPGPESGLAPPSEPEVKRAPETTSDPESEREAENERNLAGVVQPDGELLAEAVAAPEPESEIGPEREPVPEPDEAVEAESASDPEPDGGSAPYSPPTDSASLAVNEPGDATSPPTPHPERPHELWHPGFDVVPGPSLAPVVSEERISRSDVVDAAESNDAEMPFGVRRFPSNEPALSGTETSAIRPEPVVGDVGQGRDVAGDPGGVDGEPRSGEDHASATASRPVRDTLPPPVDLFALPPRDTSDADPDQTATGAPERDLDRRGTTGLTAEVIPRRPLRSPRPRRMLFGVQPAEGSRRTLPTPTGSFPEYLTAAADGTVDLVPGVIRVPSGGTVDISVTAGELGITVEAGWCWFALPGDVIRTIRAVIPAGTIVVPPGTTCLVIVEPDGSTFVAILAGSASLEQAQGKLSLATGSVALAPPGGRAQVDSATPSELAREPIVIHNIRLDEAR